MLCNSPGGLVAHPPDGKNSFLSLLQDEIIQERYSVARGVPEVLDLSREITRSTTKRKADAMLPARDDEKPIAKMLEESYWDSPEAKKLSLGDSSKALSMSWRNGLNGYSRQIRHLMAGRML